MSNIFLNNDFESLFNTSTESNIQLPNMINIVDKNNQYDNETSSAFVQQGGYLSATSTNQSNQYNNETSSAFVQQGGYLSATSTNQSNQFNKYKQSNQYDNETSSAFVQQGGNFSATSANSSSTQDVNKLISMLTSESSLSNNNLSQTSTENLEEQLKNILNHGGAKKNNFNKQNGGSNVNMNDIKKFFTTLKSQGVNVKLNDQTMSEYFNLSQNTTTDISNFVENSATSSINIQDIIGNFNHLGGGNKTTKKGVVNPGFKAFLDLKKHIAEKLNISNGKQAAKIAGVVQKEMKVQFPTLDAVSIAEKGMKHFDDKKEKYKKDFKDLLALAKKV
jgi:hypothetical protein